MYSCHLKMRSKGRSSKLISRSLQNSWISFFLTQQQHLSSKTLRRLGKISVGARNLFRDEQLDIAGAGEKVRKLIEEHVYSTGVDSKIKPVDLLATDFKEKLGAHKSSRPKRQRLNTQSSITSKSRLMMILNITKPF